MNTQVVRNYIDNQIRTLLHDKKDWEQIFSALNGKMSNISQKISEKTERGDKATYLQYHNDFAQLRMDDISNILNNKKLYKYINSNSKVLDIVRLRDKILGTYDLTELPF